MDHPGPLYWTARFLHLLVLPWFVYLPFMALFLVQSESVDLSPVDLIQLLNTGGVLGFAYLVLRSIEKLGRELALHWERRDKEIDRIMTYYREDLTSMLARMEQNSRDLVLLTEAIRSLQQQIGHEYDHGQVQE